MTRSHLPLVGAVALLNADFDDYTTFGGYVGLQFRW
jgi:hypothetical protein